jgi:hypothetical protein
VDGPRRAIEYSLLAGRSTLRTLAFDEAAARFAFALELGIDDARRRAETQLELDRSHPRRRLGRRDGGIPHCHPDHPDHRGHFAEQLEMTSDDVKLSEEINADEGVSWLFSFLSADRYRTYCLYEAPSSDAIIAPLTQSPADSFR